VGFGGDKGKWPDSSWREPEPEPELSVNVGRLISEIWMWRKGEFFWGFCEWSRRGGRVDVRRRERDMVMSLDSGTESHTLPLFLFNVKIAALQVILIFFNVKKKLKTLLISF
jgi:hypothetical protein